MVATTTTILAGSYVSYPPGKYREPPTTTTGKASLQPCHCQTVEDRRHQPRKDQDHDQPYYKRTRLTEDKRDDKSLRRLISSIHLSFLGFLTLSLYSRSALWPLG